MQDFHNNLHTESDRTRAPNYGPIIRDGPTKFKASPTDRSRIRSANTKANATSQHSNPCQRGSHFFGTSAAVDGRNSEGADAESVCTTTAVGATAEDCPPQSSGLFCPPQPKTASVLVEATHYSQKASASVLLETTNYSQNASASVLLE